MKKNIIFILVLFSTMLICIVVLCLASLYYLGFFYDGSKEKNYLSENREYFYAVINYIRENPIEGCSDLDPPDQLLNWNNQKTILVCMYDNGKIEWMSFNNPFGTARIIYIEDETERPKGTFIGNLPYRGYCTHKLENEWFLCNLSGR